MDVYEPCFDHAKKLTASRLRDHGESFLTHLSKEKKGKCYFLPRVNAKAIAATATIASTTIAT